MSEQIRLEFIFIVSTEEEKQTLFENYLNGNLLNMLTKALDTSMTYKEDTLQQILNEVSELKKIINTSTSDNKNDICRPIKNIENYKEDTTYQVTKKENNEKIKRKGILNRVIIQRQ